MAEKENREQWLKALLYMGKSGETGARLNQLLSLVTGGEIQYVQWLYPTLNDEKKEKIELQTILTEQLQLEGLQANWPEQMPSWQGAGILQNRTGEFGLYVIAAYADMTDFYQEELREQFIWLQQMQRKNDFPVRLLLLAFCQDTYAPEKHPQLLAERQWEEVLEKGMQMIIGEGNALAEVNLLTMVAYDTWLLQLAEKGGDHLSAKNGVSSL